ncbi:MAG: aminopeptidase N [Planctomycetota bacterium]|nr:MAG: aminopeptidase N [Planctomycetota bacterium]
MPEAETKRPPVEKFRKDYRPPSHEIERLELDFDLHEDGARVRSRMWVRRRPEAPTDADFVLDGEDLELVSLRLDGRDLGPAAYTLDDARLVLPAPPAGFELACEVRIRPQDNTRLSGLYRSSGMFCTQCEAEGFRRITFFPDRPDVMTRYRVRIEADRGRYPVLLSNGNLVEQGEAGAGRHFAVWEDPFKKPSYLFALVAGDLGCLEGDFTTRSGRRVALRLWSEHENVDKLRHALASLQRAMRWDEEEYGREYDLDVFNIVAVGDFNMGAMENKSLNIFNTAYVLARPDTATDEDFDLIEGVVGHEYFHNWTGNRVTCRDWFQLTLKEGLTVFRDQQFSAAMASAAVKRIEDVKALRKRQFPEDAGPLAHPIRPESYVAMDNFYTATVYNKGAEVVRMFHTLLGRDGFRRGMDLYFERHDGQAVSCDDFRAALADANGVDLDRFERWYSQAGTPVVEAVGTWDEAGRRYTLRLAQCCPPTPGQERKEPFPIPIAVGLIGPDGADLPLRLAGEERAAAPGSRVLLLEREVQEFVFTDLPARPVPSLLRNFSAPVRLRMEVGDEELAFRLAHDSDAFNRWQAGQDLFQRVILQAYRAFAGGADPVLPEVVRDAWRTTLLADGIDRSLQAYALTPPDEAVLAEEISDLDPALLHRAREWLLGALAAACAAELRARREELAPVGPYRHDPAETGRRRLRNLCLGLLARLAGTDAGELCWRQFTEADNMTDQEAALRILASLDLPERERALADFADRWRDDPLVMDKWFAVQAGADLPDTVERVAELVRHPAFTLRNPNRARSVIRHFAANLPHFHRADGAGYRFLADQILELDAINPQVAAREVQPLGRWGGIEPGRRRLMRAEMERIAAADLSRDLDEVVRRSLAD